MTLMTWNNFENDKDNHLCIKLKIKTFFFYKKLPLLNKISNFNRTKIKLKGPKSKVHFVTELKILFWAMKMQQSTMNTVALFYDILRKTYKIDGIIAALCTLDHF
ncbi:hypothetical protein BpHYR1_006207 [Brachionus plicatilis]|uniref:Uncharacterized protein n=1 Tax=Brachionus plicatilis TaxID=10195 RepID=A0A3M7SM10_BRAPC|nr:hypothetical protein BpHYR1_006207 [Brachionus plicatilis]